MQIKGMDGQHYNVTGQGQGNFNTVGAAAGIASLLGIDLGSILGNRWNPNMSADALVAALAATKNGSNDAVISSIISAIVALIPQMVNNNQPSCSDNTYVNRYELNQARETDSLRAENALLKSQVYTDQKMVEQTKYLDGKIEALAAEVRANKDAQNAINLEQSALNATQTSTINCMKQQIAQLNGNFENLTKNYVPSYNVCQQGCGCAAGYGAGYSYGCGAQVLG